VGVRPIGSMKVRVIVTDATGEIFEGEVRLAPRSTPKKQSKKKGPEAKAPRNLRREALDLDLPLRPFLKKYAPGKSGAAKLTLLIAHMVGGKKATPVEAGTVQAAWNRVTAFLGDYNRAHWTRAKDKGWIDSPKHGQYVLRPTWEEAATD
jgi:hypothetical protein